MLVLGRVYLANVYKTMVKIGETRWLTTIAPGNGASSSKGKEMSGSLGKTEDGASAVGVLQAQSCAFWSIFEHDSHMN